MDTHRTQHLSDPVFNQTGLDQLGFSFAHIGRSAYISLALPVHPDMCLLECSLQRLFLRLSQALGGALCDSRAVVELLIYTRAA